MGWTRDWAVSVRTLGGRAGRVFLRRELIPFLPAIALAGLWFGHESMLLLGMTAMAVAWLTRPAPTEASDTDPVTGLPQRAEAERILDGLLEATARNGLNTACLVVGLDDAEPLRQRLGHGDFETLLQRMVDRLRTTLRDADRIARLENARFAILLTPTPKPDLENMIQLAVRLQTACELALPVGARTLDPTVHVGICLSERAPVRRGAAMIMAAETAATEAQAQGPGAIRVFSDSTSPEVRMREELAGEIAAALEHGQIIAYFQPQISTDTGEVSGMLAVPRWLHRSRGALGPDDILSAAAAQNLLGRLHDVMLHHALDALRGWRRLGIDAGPVSLAITPEMLTDSRMADKLSWELDRFDVEADRICLVLDQNVLVQFDDSPVSRNLAACAAMGCAIELAGFGAGPLSVQAIRRTQIRRVRLPRSLVTRVDRDADQQRIVAAVISMAEGLEIETLAEGVSTLGENALLAQLGCRHVQGSAIAAPMPFDETPPWIAAHRVKLGATPRIPTRRGV
ncbi:EAL domain-containing protein [Paenirhodobacter sp.]|uniref:EAL domain-containing protein n=1 Tax=Paenirhodobacter sp. TaxID=1965326 RepID=UPI003B3FD7F9